MNTESTHRLAEIPSAWTTTEQNTANRPIYDPATGELIGHAPVHTTQDLDAAVSSARRAQPAWAALGHEERAALLRSAADAIEANGESLAILLSREQGKPLNGPNARLEVGQCAGWLRDTAGLRLETETVVADETVTAELQYRPLGVVGSIGPWNWPMIISIWHIAPALLMGNTLVVKPSEYTPLSVLALASVLNTVLPEGVLNVVSGDRLVGEALSSHPEIAKIMFTGSTQTGKAIMQSAAPTLKRLTLELGGNDAAIVLPDVSPREIAMDLFWSAFNNTGQTCAALKRLYVHEDIYEETVVALADLAGTIPMGNGLDEENVLGPLQNKAQYEIVTRLVDVARASGARLVTGGNPDVQQPGYFYPTTIVADIDNDNPLVAEEQFGPALPIIKYTTTDEAVAMANGLAAGLSASVWSSDPEAAALVAERLEAGTVFINRHGGPDPRIPFGGIKESGFGLSHGLEGLKQMSVPRVLVK